MVLQSNSEEDGESPDQTGVHGTSPTFRDQFESPVLDSESPGPEIPFADLYDRAVQDLLDVPVTERWVETGGGPTHILTVGDPANPPVVVFQGGNITNPVTLAWFQELADEYHVIAPDTPGQPGKSATREPSEFGHWVIDILDDLGIDRVPMVGASHGAGVLLEVAVHAPERIAAAALVAPAGFGTPLSLSLARIVVPSLAYRLTGRGSLLHKALAPMFTRPVADIDSVTVETIGLALRTSDLAADFPGPEDLKTLAGFHAPTLVILGEGDPFFPEERTRRRAERFLPSLIDCVTLDGERHFLSPEGQSLATDRVRSFLAIHVEPE